MNGRRERDLIRELQADWPAPVAEAQELSNRLRERIEQEIEAADGGIGFDRYMERVLYEPGLGYYSAGLPRFGRGGDFITAPLVSPLFSRTLALQCADCLQEAGGVILELGAGNGRMAADLLAELAARRVLPERYLILEVSATLRDEQRRTLSEHVPQLMDRVEWLDRLPETPLTGVVLANEVLDALPVERFSRGPSGIEEWQVTCDAEGFGWRRVAASEPLARAVTAIEADLGRPLADGYTSEICLRLPPWLRALADSLAQGVMLFVDYGYPRAEYYHPQRSMGTLICQYRHRAHDNPLILPGLQDITAFVDFTAVAEAGLSAGLEVLGFTPQAQFLLAAGLPELLEREMTAASTSRQIELAQQVKTLTLPGEMGERFKVMALGREYASPLRGFSLSDQRGRL